MTLPNLGVSAALIFLTVAACCWAVASRIAARQSALEAEFPPQGQVLMVNGKRVHVIVQGVGPDLVLIHGASGNALDLIAALGPDLAQSHRVIAFDRPGLGYSDPLADQSLKAQALHLAEAARQLDVQAPLVVGQSYGGSVSLAWALFAPHPPRGLVLISAPSMPWPGKLDLSYRAADTLAGRAVLLPLAAALVPRSYITAAVKTVFAPDTPPPTYAKTISAALILRLPSLRANMAQVNALRAQLVAMQPHYAQQGLPMELLHGTEDTIVPLAVHSIPFAQQVASAKLRVIEGAGHMPHYSHRDEVLAAIARAEARAALH